MKRALRRLLFTLTGAVAGLACGDALLFLCARQPGVDVPRGMYVADPEVGYRLAPNFRGVMRTPTFAIDVATNELGLRGPPLRDRNDGHRRVLVLGDSFVFGYAVGVNDTIGACLERALAGDAAGIEVVSAGAPGYGPAHELFLLKRLLSDVRPDIVVHGFCCGNDVPDALKLPQQQTVFRGALVDRTVPERYAGALGAVRFEVGQFFEGTQLLRLFHHWEIRGVRAEILKSFASDTSPRAALAWRIVEQCLRDLQTTCAQGGAKLLTVALPMQVQVDPPYRKSTFGDLELTPEQLLWPQRKLGEFAAAAALPFEDLTPLFTRECATRRLYQPLDDHFDAAGNALAAARIAARLRELGWLAATSR
jgi:lysophospholipase L1-like esterase